MSSIPARVIVQVLDLTDFNLGGGIRRHERGQDGKIALEELYIALKAILHPDQLDTANCPDEFDNTVMNLLFETGYKLAHYGYRWRKIPPGFFSEDQEDTAAQ